ncbi:hypothetical protein ACFSNO_07415 [Streptomyces cirratus]|uniref:hypothetical protein n=1 Tax=Streptomyces cirratus TaxID=68187 RepID=UPI001E402C34|nr:hypothetical protein [Streptomyces cirratus]
MTGRPQTVCLLHWHGEPPYGLTVLGLPADRLSEAEEAAGTALAGLVLPTSWQDADPALRRSVVAACRPVGAVRLWHVTDERPDTDAARARRDCLRALADEWPQAGPVADQSRLPGLNALLGLTALVCRMPPEVWLDAEEDLLDIYDTYTVGGL